jgi:hypothetical protein
MLDRVPFLNFFVPKKYQSFYPERLFNVLGKSQASCHLQLGSGA